MPLASFHVIRHSSSDVPHELSPRALSWQWGRCGRDSASFPSDDVTYAYLGTWRDAADLRSAVAAIDAAGTTQLAWHVELQVVSRRGEAAYRDTDPFTSLPPTARPSGTTAIVTSIRLDRADEYPRFVEDWDAAVAQLQTAPGLIASANLVPEVGDPLTFTVWESLSAALSYAYGDGKHRCVRDRHLEHPVGSATSFARADVLSIKGCRAAVE